MPESPEVQVIVDQLNLLKGARLSNYTIFDKRWLGKRKKLENLNQSILVDVQRKAKYIIFHFRKNTDDIWIVNHLAMSGGWFFHKILEKTSIHTRISFTFVDLSIPPWQDSSQRLDFVDPRRFGRFDIYLADEFWNEKLQTKFSNLGLDVLRDTITYQSLVDQIHKFTDRHPEWEIKPLLMEQTFLSGIGNYLACDICFLAGIDPFKKADELTSDELKNLEEAIPAVSKNSYIAGGATIRDYKSPTGEAGKTAHLVYGKKSCPLCKSQISKGPQAGRTTHWCPKCQKMN